MVPIARSLPLTGISAGELVELARRARKLKNTSQFLRLWQVERKEACTVFLGAGNLGSAFQVCKGKGSDGQTCKQCAVAKFGVSMTKQGVPKSNMWDGLTKDELRATEHVDKLMRKASPHFVGYRGGVSYKRPQETSILFLEFIESVSIPGSRKRAGHLEAGIMYDVLAEDDVRDLMFQTVYSLLALLPHARHNDIKLDNVGLMKWDGEPHSYDAMGRRFLLPPQKYMAKILDFGLLHGRTHAKLRNEGVEEDYGLD